MLRFPCEFDSIEKFYRVVHCLNKNHKGKWTMNGKVLKFLKKDKSVIREIIVYSDNVSSEVLEIYLENKI